MSAKGFFRPTGFKILLSIIFILPLALIIGFMLLSANRTFILLGILLLGLIVDYIVSCCIDTFINNKIVKIIIASVSAAISLLISYYLIKLFTTPMLGDPMPNPIVCDPVHQPQTWSDPVHPVILAAPSKGILQEAGKVTASIKQKFNECVKNCRE